MTMHPVPKLSSSVIVAAIFYTIAKIQCESHKVLDMLKKDDFQDIFQEWQEHWECYIVAIVDYFEGDGV